MPYHPKSNGLAERCVWTFKERMCPLENNAGTVQEKLKSILFAYRTSPKRSTRKSPAFMMISSELQTKVDLLISDVDSKLDEV